MKLRSTIFILPIFFLLLSACSDQTNQFKLQEGDLLFQDLDCGEFCEAIEAVTHGVDGRDFSHCAMVVKVGDSLKVVEAIGKGVILTPIEDFLKRSGDTNTVENIVVSRVSANHKPLIEKASEYALSKVGEPYDYEFILDNGSWYCSELLYESFKHANDGNEFFHLFPMTYKMPGQEEFFPIWVDYYMTLERPIPEGEPGLNPGSVSRSDKLKRIDIDLTKTLK